MAAMISPAVNDPFNSQEKVDERFDMAMHCAKRKNNATAIRATRFVPIIRCSSYRTDLIMFDELLVTRSFASNDDGEKHKCQDHQ